MRSLSLTSYSIRRLQGDIYLDHSFRYAGTILTRGDCVALFRPLNSLMGANPCSLFFMTDVSSCSHRIRWAMSDHMILMLWSGHILRIPLWTWLYSRKLKWGRDFDLQIIQICIREIDVLPVQQVVGDQFLRRGLRRTIGPGRRSAVIRRVSFRALSILVLGCSPIFTRLASRIIPWFIGTIVPILVGSTTPIRHPYLRGQMSVRAISNYVLEVWIYHYSSE